MCHVFRQPASIVMLAFLTLLSSRSTISSSEPITVTWKESNLGTQVNQLNIIGATFGSTDTDRGCLYAVLTGNPAHFVVVNAAQKITHDIPVENVDGAYPVLQASDGNIYFGSKPNCHLYRYRPGGDTIEDLGRVSETGVFVWEMTELPGGRLFMALYQKAEVVEYNIARNEFHSWGPAKEGEEYCRSIAWSDATQKLYCGVGAHAALIEWDTGNGEKRDILPEQYRDRHFVYTIDERAGKLIAKLDPVYDGFVLDLRTGAVDQTLPGYHSQMASPLAPDGKSVYYTTDGKLMRYNIEAKTLDVVNEDLGGEGKAFLFGGDNGAPALSVLSSAGDLAVVDLNTNTTTLIPIAFARQPGTIQSIVLGPDGRIYTAGFLSGGVGAYDPETGMTTEYAGIDQSEGMTCVGNTMYFGVYPRARFYSWDVTTDWNPKELGELEDEGQDRPFAMLGAGDVGRVFFGTVPSYGLHGGAFGWYDIATGTFTLHRNIVPDQCLITMCRAGDIVYAGSSYSGGLGIPPKASEARLIGWDVKKDKLDFSLAPVPGKRWITGLAVGPDGNVWGWAEEALFVFDVKTRQTIFTKTYTPRTITNEHVWRDYSMLNGGDGYMYATVYGRFLRVNAETREMEDIAEGPALHQIAQDRHGAFYYIEKNNLMKMEKVAPPE